MPTSKMLEQTNGHIIYGSEDSDCNCKICSHKIQPGEVGVIANPNITLYCCECFDKCYEKEFGKIPDDHFRFKKEESISSFNTKNFQILAVMIEKDLKKRCDAKENDSICVRSIPSEENTSLVLMVWMDSSNCSVSKEIFTEKSKEIMDEAKSYMPELYFEIKII